MDEYVTVGGKRKADGEFVTKKVFDGSEPEPKRRETIPPPPSVPDPDDDDVPPSAAAPAADASASKPASTITILDFKDIKPHEHLMNGGKLETTKKNGAKFVKLALKDQNTIIRSPRLFINGFFANDSGYTLKGTVLGLPGDHKHGEPVPADPKYPNQPQAELDDKGKAFDAAMDIDEYCIQLIAAHPEWFKWKQATDEAGRQKILEHVRKNWRPTMHARRDEQSGRYYSPQFSITFAVGEDGKELFSIKDDTGKPLDIRNMILKQGGEKKPGMSVVVGMTFRRITFPNIGEFRFGLQIIGQSVKVLRGNSGGSFREDFRDVSLD